MSQSDLELDSQDNFLTAFGKGTRNAVRATKKGFNNLRANADDPMVQLEIDRKYADLHPDLKRWGDMVTDGATVLKRGMYPSLLQQTRTGKTVYDKMLTEDIESPMFKLVEDFLKIDPLNKIYLIVVKLADSGEEVRIPIAAFPVESIIPSGDEDSTIVYLLIDNSFFPYSMKNGKLVPGFSNSDNILDLNKLRGDIGVIAELAEHFPFTETENLETGMTTTNWHWDENIANGLARDAILKVLKKIAEEQIGRELLPNEEVELYEFVLEIYTKETLSIFNKQTGVSALPISMISQFAFADNIKNREDFLANLQKLQRIRPSRDAIANAILSQGYTKKLQYSLRPPEENVVAHAPTQDKKRGRTDKQNEIAEARLQAFKKIAVEEGGSLKKTKTKTKRSKRHRKTKKYRKTNKHRKHRSNKSKRHKR